MTKVAASDFDGTLFQGGDVPAEELEAINTWRRQGQKFGLATGRDLNMILPELRVFDVPFDFLVVSSGAALYDRDLNLLHAETVSPDAAQDVLDHPAGRRSHYFALSRDDKTYIDIFSQGPAWLDNINHNLQPFNTSLGIAMNGIQQISLEYPDAAEARRCLDELRGDFGGYLDAHLAGGVCIQITQSGVDKASGLARLCELKGWPSDDVLVAGDSDNDLVMFQRFRGYAMNNSPKVLKDLAFRVVASPAVMLMDELRQLGSTF